MSAKPQIRSARRSGYPRAATAPAPVWHHLGVSTKKGRSPRPGGVVGALRATGRSAAGLLLITAGLITATASVPVAQFPSHRPSLLARRVAGSVTGEDIVPLLRWSAPEAAAPYTPAQVTDAYDLAPLYRAGLTGKGATIGIVDVYGVPTIRAELARFDANYKIPAPPAFRIVEPAGRVPAFSSRNPAMASWAAETTLDVEWAHAMAPGAAIDLALTGVDEVEGTSGFAQIVRAERYLIEDEHVSVISQSFAATEETFPTLRSLTALRGAFVLAKLRDVTVLGAAGDWGASSPTSTSGDFYDRRVVNWPASDPLVTAVGGSQVFLGSSGRQLGAPRVWNDHGTATSVPSASGGGVSADFARPSWQNSVASVVGNHRGIPDISMDASCRPGVAVYLALPGEVPASVRACGTSLAAPLFAGIVAIADELAGHSLGLLNPALYRLGAEHAPGLVDVTAGNNSVRVPTKTGSAVVTGYSAAKGYDLASGWGTVNAADLVPELAGKALISGRSANRRRRARARPS